MSAHRPVSCNCEESNWPTHYNNTYDAHFCPDCDVWLEERCDDIECDYCSTRPAKPSKAPEFDEIVNRNKAKREIS